LVLDLVIVPDFPEIFNEFRKKWFSLLWRSGRDDFNACDFQDRCDGHVNTLTLIENTKGNIFGGWKPITSTPTPIETIPASAPVTPTTQDWTGWRSSQVQGIFK
jgi:hypothetical protein